MLFLFFNLVYLGGFFGYFNLLELILWIFIDNLFRFVNFYNFSFYLREYFM